MGCEGKIWESSLEIFQVSIFARREEKRNVLLICVTHMCEALDIERKHFLTQVHSVSLLLFVPFLSSYFKNRGTGVGSSDNDVDNRKSR